MMIKGIGLEIKNENLGKINFTIHRNVSAVILDEIEGEN